MAQLERLVVLMSVIGVISALDCIECKWSAENSTVDDDCLGAPYRTSTVTCPKGNSPGERYMCQTHAEFEVQSGVKNLKAIERECGLKHSKCNNACAEATSSCWLCCDDNNNCNGFPLRTNVVVTTSAADKPNYIDFKSYRILATVWLISLMA